MNTRKYTSLLAGSIVLLTMVGTPVFAQTADNPAQQAAPAAKSGDTSGSQNGVSPESSSQADKPSGPIEDKDVFGFDISGTTALTAEQQTAARNTCRDSVTADPMRYSSAVKTFCDTLK